MTRWLMPLLWAGLAAAQNQAGTGCCGYGMGMGMGMGPVTGAPLVDIAGRVSQVRITPGQGMPSIVVKTGTGESAVLLGPLRYLMAQNFNPKVGDDVAVKAYKTPNGLIAASVTLSSSKKVLRLRDDDGWPVWRGGRW